MVSHQPWQELPADVAPVLRPLLPELADEMIAAVRTLPAYSRPMEGAFAEGIRSGVEAALGHFLAEVEAGEDVARPDVYEQLGRGEMRAGRTLDSLLSAYRMGARVAWRRFAAAGVAASLTPDTLYALAESLFAYIDVLSAESAAGHAAEQSAVATVTGLSRRRLVRMLIRDPPHSLDELEAAAVTANWTLPRSLAALAIGGPGADRVVAGLQPSVVADTFADLVCVIVPDPDGPGQRSGLERTVRAAGACAGLGTSGGWDHGGLSFARARAALVLGRGAPGLVSAREHAGILLLRADPGLGGLLAEDRLAPLEQLAAGPRTRLTETLTVWLDEQGRLGAVAARLGVHPQTARYRVARLRELFGPALDDGAQRFWLQTALRVRGQLAADGAASGSGAGSGASGTSGPS